MMTSHDTSFFQARRFDAETTRPDDVRDPYERDRARVIHSSGFRRLQGKTQVMGVGEGDFHRTRLTHSIECAQVGTGVLEQLQRGGNLPDLARAWMPTRALVEAACFAHDLGHPPFGHGGEQALFREMRMTGGFEGNAQTLRLLSVLEKHSAPERGLNPTRRFALSVLKYPACYSSFDFRNLEKFQWKPPKCYYDEEAAVVEWASEGFSPDDRAWLSSLDQKGRPANRTLDCSLMELGDDIAYGVHDIEDIVARHLAPSDLVRDSLIKSFAAADGRLRTADGILDANLVHRELFADSYRRKQMMGRLVNVFIVAATASDDRNAVHPLLRFRVGLEEPHRGLLDALKKMSFALVIEKAPVQQLEQRGMRVVADLFKAFLANPNQLIPSWDKDYLGATSKARRVCDYVAGMTDSYAERVYRRLFVPGFGSSSDEL